MLSHTLKDDFKNSKKYPKIDNKSMKRCAKGFFDEMVRYKDRA